MSNKEIVILVCFGIMYRLALHFFLFDEVIVENDSSSYFELAQRISNCNLMGYGGERTMGYPILMNLGFNSYKVVVFYQHILGIVTGIFVYKTVLNFNFSKRNSLWITLFMQSFLNLFFYESSILVETLTLFILSIVFYAVSKNLIDNRNFVLDFSLSFLLGYLTLIKPFYAFIPFVIYGFIVLKNFSILRIINKRIVLLFFPLLVYFGTSYFNKVNTGSFTSTTFLGYNLAQNCVYFAEKGPKEFDWIGIPYAKHRDLILEKDPAQSAAMAIWDTYYSGAFEDKKLSFAQLSDEMERYAKATIEKNPRDYFKQVVTKSIPYFYRPTISMNEQKLNSKEKQFFFNSYWFFQRKLSNVFKYGFWIVLLFYGFTFLKNRVITNELIIITIVFAASVLQGLVTYGTNARYSFPFEYIMVLMGCVWVKNHLKRPKFLNTFSQ